MKRALTGFAHAEGVVEFWVLLCLHGHRQGVRQLRVMSLTSGAQGEGRLELSLLPISDELSRGVASYYIPA